MSTERLLDGGAGEASYHSFNKATRLRCGSESKVSQSFTSRTCLYMARLVFMSKMVVVTDLSFFHTGCARNPFRAL